MNESDDEKKVPPASEQDFPIVGVGASAGGIDAFKRFLKAVPEDSGMAYVLVQHLDPSHESILPDILRRVTKIPVNEITDEIHLAPNHIYVIPENKILTSTDGVLKLTARDKIKRNLPIDIFFTSLAEIHQGLAVGIVLSGSASDGTLGLKSIKEHGGITFVQDQASATIGEMPQNALNAGVVDFVLAPEDMPAKLLQLLALPKTDDGFFKEVLTLLHQRSGVDFTYYKQTTIRRRIARRMAIAKKDSLASYFTMLQADKVEQDKLFMDVLIPVTTFFRDTQTFDILCNNVVPVLLKDHPDEGPVRAWVAACSTGEEAYSLAICFHESITALMPGKKIQIFASDVSESAIRKARAGFYSKAEVLTVPETRLRKYFIEKKDGYQVNQEIRDICVFAVHNFLKDPPFVRMDLVSCRNVLIYMDTSLQKKALSTFHYALKKTGFLLLGKSETTGMASELFTPYIKNDKIYSRKSMPGRYVYFSTEDTGDKNVINGKGIPGKKTYNTEDLQIDFRKNAESILLSKYTPPAVIINEQMDIVHIHGSIKDFLEPPQGKPSFNLLKMAKEGLGFELRNTLFKAKGSNTKVIKEGIPVNYNGGGTMLVTIEVLPLVNTPEQHYLILFYKNLLADAASAANDADDLIKNGDKARIQQLEKELSQLREDMRGISEDQEAVNEELQSGNEELQSTGEELQSLNEELETSKEELQSTNEELIIVNQEMLEKQLEIDSARKYAEAVITTVKDPLLVLDKNFFIRSISNAFFKKFNITQLEAVSKSIFTIKNGLFDKDKFRTLLEKVLPQRIEVSDYEIVMPLPAAGDRTMLLNARQIDNQQNDEKLILLTIEDITERKKVQQELQTLYAEMEEQVAERTAALNQTNLQLEGFAHTASHELQEPLRKIITFSKILKTEYEANKPQQVKAYLDKIDDAAERLKTLVEHLLNFASVTRHEQLFEVTNLNNIFNTIVFDFELVIAEKRATITSDKLPELKVIPFQMNQLFYDLISNALKFTRPGVPPVIHISCRQLTKEAVKDNLNLNNKWSYYELIFKDNGIGFDQKYALQIFTMFQKLGNATTYAGTGVGLALCKKIVQGYQGDIFAEGKENEGAAFHVILPFPQSTHVKKMKVNNQRLLQRQQ